VVNPDLGTLINSDHIALLTGRTQLEVAEDDIGGSINDEPRVGKAFNASTMGT